MKWVQLTRTSGEHVWINLERFDIIEETVDIDDIKCTTVTMVIDETVTHDVYVKEKPEDFLFLPEENFEKKRTKEAQNVRGL